MIKAEGYHKVINYNKKVRKIISKLLKISIELKVNVLHSRMLYLRRRPRTF